MKAFSVKALSQYEGHKRLDKANERIAIGDKQPELMGHRREGVQGYFCTVCKTWKRSFKLLRTHTRGMGGERVKNLRGWYIKACTTCAAMIEGSGGSLR